RPAIDRVVSAGKQIGLPRIAGGDIEPRSWQEGEPLEAASFGAMEPVNGRRLEASEIDAVVTPGVAFDLEGYRVGYGAGFYDRLFATLDRDVSRVAIGFELQVVAGSLPRASFDLPVDVLVTQDRVVRFGAGPEA